MNEWKPIESAPKDRRILVWCVHANAKYAKDPIAEGWEAAVIAEWTGHNGGGWTWHGMAGKHTHWMPLPDPPTLNVPARDAGIQTMNLRGLVFISSVTLKLFGYTSALISTLVLAHVLFTVVCLLTGNV